jgi:NAD(P)-dependent dehydrogenase (short-subunit alcohol dehydrogenase family)
MASTNPTASASSSSNNSNSKVWLITGASSGFGRDLARLLLEQCHKVVATARKPETLTDLIAKYPATGLALPLDVLSQSSVDKAIADATAHFGRIDVLINNAGYGIAGAVEEVTEAEFMPVFETNLFGLVRVTKAVLPQLREQCSGHIVNVSSIGDLIGLPSWGYYNATKFAVNGLSEALAAEVEPLGIKVLVVEPGPFRTEFLGSSGKQAEKRIADYDKTAGRTRENFEVRNGKQPGDPVRGAQAMIDAVLAPEPPKHLLLGRMALDLFHKRLQDWTTHLNQWESVTLGADYPEDAANGRTAQASDKSHGTEDARAERQEQSLK